MIYKYDYKSLPELPKGGVEVAKELTKICKPESNCLALNMWLNQIYLFSLEYDIYKNE